MKEVADAFWRAAAYCLHPRVMLLSLAPLLLSGGAVLGLAWLYWEGAVDAVRTTLEGWSLVGPLLQWLDAVGGGAFRSVIAPVIVVALAVPLIVLTSLLLVAWLMTPALVSLVARRRFPGLERRGSMVGWWQGLAWSLGCTLVALVFLLLSVPLWLIPPLALVLPPLIWGWLAARVLAFDTLASHADAQERRLLLHTHRWVLLGMGVLVGMAGSAPSLLWVAGAFTLILAPVLAAASVWLYTLMFAFGSLWFAHFTLARLERLRQAATGSAAPAGHSGASPGPAPLPLPPAPSASPSPPALPSPP